jgi:hypothetical protein
MDIIPSTFFPFIESVSLFHNCVHSDEVTTIDLDSGKEQVGVKQGRPELNFAGTSAGTHLWKFSKLPSSNWLNLEARVGIERGSFTVPSLTHSVSRLIPALFYRSSSYFFGYLFNATHCPVTASKLPSR